MEIEIMAKPTTCAAVTRTTAASKALPAQQTHEAQDTVLVLDCSDSMTLDDYRPNRLDAAKSSAWEYVEARKRLSPQDRVAVVSYESFAKRHCGLEPLQTCLPRVGGAIRAVSSGGSTAMGRGLLEAEHIMVPASCAYHQRLWAWFLGCDEPVSVNRACLRIILLTDGHHNEGTSPIPVATRLKDARVVIDCIGIGGHPSDVDEDLLRRLASLDDRGLPRYRFIRDRAKLTEHFRRLAMGITR
jgi:hypothetical protein